MIDEILQLTGSLSADFKKKFYGTTFRCPVCHLELAHADLDANGLVVCPLCGVVMEVEEVYGHNVPVINDVELFRPQPKSRLHPLAAHLPIGLFPLAVAGAVLVLAISAIDLLWKDLPTGWLAVIQHMPLMADATLLLLVLSVVFSAPAFALGYRDWKRRYRGRPYRIIRLKIVFSALFLVLGTSAAALHGAGLVMRPGTGLFDLASPTHFVLGLVYLGLLAANLCVIATLGHVGGNLVYGK